MIKINVSILKPIGYTLDKPAEFSLHVKDISIDNKNILLEVKYERDSESLKKY